MALDFQRNLSIQKDFYSAQATHSQQSPFLMPSFHLPDLFLPIAEPHLAFLKAKPQRNPIQFKHSTYSALIFPHRGSDVQGHSSAAENLGVEVLIAEGWGFGFANHKCKWKQPRRIQLR